MRPSSEVRFGKIGREIQRAIELRPTRHDRAPAGRDAVRDRDGSARRPPDRAARWPRGRVSMRRAARLLGVRLHPLRPRGTPSTMLDADLRLSSSSSADEEAPGQFVLAYAASEPLPDAASAVPSTKCASASARLRRTASRAASKVAAWAVATQPVGMPQVERVVRVVRVRLGGLVEEVDRQPSLRRGEAAQSARRPGCSGQQRTGSSSANAVKILKASSMLFQLELREPAQKLRAPRKGNPAQSPQRRRGRARSRSGST